MISANRAGRRTIQSRDRPLKLPIEINGAFDESAYAAAAFFTASTS